MEVGGVFVVLLVFVVDGQVLEFWDNGVCWWLLLLCDVDVVCSLLLDMVVLVDWSFVIDVIGVVVFVDEVGVGYVCVVCVFCFVDVFSVFEDLVIGSVNVLIGVWLMQYGVLFGGGGCFVVSQGCEVGCDGCVQVQVDVQGMVWIGGQVQLVIDGYICWLQS